jgi:hypothetical protein
MKAFPTVNYVKPGGELGTSVMTINGGMDLRDYFAVHAPDYTESWQQAHCRNHGWKGDAHTRAVWNYEFADEMMKAREK